MAGEETRTYVPDQDFADYEREQNEGRKPVMGYDDKGQAVPLPEFGFHKSLPSNAQDRRPPPAPVGSEREIQQKKEEAAAQGQEGSDNAKQTAGDDDENRNPNQHGWLKKRLDRERKKLDEKDKEIERLKAELSAKSPPPAEPAKKEEPAAADPGPRPEMPRRSDYGSYPDFANALEKHFEDEKKWEEAQDARNALPPSGTDETKTEEKRVENEERPVQRSALEEKAKVAEEFTILDDVLEILDMDESATEDLGQKLIDSKNIAFDLDMAEWIVENPDHAVKVCQKFVDSPVISRRIARKTTADKMAALDKLAAEEPEQVQQEPGVESMSQLRGSEPPRRGVQRELNEIPATDFVEYEKQRREQERNEGQGMFAFR